jgi:hypothetical protein
VVADSADAESPEGLVVPSRSGYHGALRVELAVAAAPGLQNRMQTNCAVRRSEVEASIALERPVGTLMAAAVAAVILSEPPEWLRRCCRRW